MSRARRTAVRTGGRGTTKRIAGVEIAGDPEIDCERHPPSKLFPDYKTTPPKPLSDEETIQVARFLSLRSNIHEGPFFTVLGENVRVGKSSAIAASFDPFGGMPTYSQKYLKRRRRIPKLDSRPYVLRFFPKELWSTLDPKSVHIQAHEDDENENGGGRGGAMGKKTLRLFRDRRAAGSRSLNNRDPLSARGDDAEAEAGGEQDGDGDEEGLREDQDGEEEEEEEEELDDEFEANEDSGDDYNAEQYFGDGGEDGGNDYDGGEAEGGDFF